jgi:serine/threonine protein kinase
MSVAVGQRIGAFELTGSLGAGGMGEVHRATDTKLKRHVAIKILPGAVASDSDRLARFRREAEVLASLNHPNIAAIYGFEDASGVHALVLELVEGKTLEEFLAARALPLDDALKIARQIGEALEAAHERGIVHRDLKPANIKVRDDGTVKVLDFGLAKALDPAAGFGLQASGPRDETDAARGTMAGVILGTPAYMSPEQARGQVVDKRTDVWAFGCVLYEMVSGQRPFAGEEITDLVVGVVSQKPDWSVVPRPVLRLIQACLEKDPRSVFVTSPTDGACSTNHQRPQPQQPHRRPDDAWPSRHRGRSRRLRCSRSRCLDGVISMNCDLKSVARNSSSLRPMECRSAIRSPFLLTAAGSHTPWRDRTTSSEASGSDRWSRDRPMRCRERTM